MPSSSEDGFRRKLLVAGILVPFAFLAGCANPGKDRLDAFRTRLSLGDIQGGLDQVRSSKALYGEKSAYLWEMDLGVLHHYLGDWDSSIVHIERAENIADDLYARSLSNEALSLATSDNMRPYRPKQYESVLLAQFQLLSYLAKGDLDGGLVEVRRGGLLLDRLRERDSGKYHDDGGLEYLHSIVYQASGKMDDAKISLRRSLIAYSTGKVPLPAEVRDMATWVLRDDPRGKVFEENGISKGTDLEGVKDLLKAPSEIVLLVYRGRTPEIDQLRAWGEWVQGGLFAWHWSDPSTGKEVTDAIPLFLPGANGTTNGRTFHVNFTFPVLKEVEPRVVRVEVETPAGVRKPTTLSDTRILLDQALADAHNALVVRTVIRVGTRTLAAQKLKSAVQTGNPLLDLAANVGMDFAQGGIEQSDTRQCIWLPREVGVVRIPVEPGSYAIRSKAVDRTGHVLGEKVFGDVTVRKGETRFLVSAFPY